jgi:hypothetical protein
MVYVRRERLRHQSWAAAAESVVTAMYCLPAMLNDTGYPCTEVPSRVSQSNGAGLDVERAEASIQIAHERDTARGRQHGGQERRALLYRPARARAAH